MTCVATFLTHFGALTLQRTLKKAGTPASMMPVPRSLSASCGVCVRFTAPDPEAARGTEDLEAVDEEDKQGYRLLFRPE